MYNRIGTMTEIKLGDMKTATVTWLKPEGALVETCPRNLSEVGRHIARRIQEDPTLGDTQLKVDIVVKQPKTPELSPKEQELQKLYEKLAQLSQDVKNKMLETTKTGVVQADFNALAKELADTQVLADNINDELKDLEEKDPQPQKEIEFEEKSVTVIDGVTGNLALNGAQPAGDNPGAQGILQRLIMPPQVMHELHRIMNSIQSVSTLRAFVLSAVFDDAGPAGFITFSDDAVVTDGHIMQLHAALDSQLKQLEEAAAKWNIELEDKSRIVVPGDTEFRKPALQVIRGGAQ